MRLRTVLALIGISLLTQGCQLAWDATTNVVFETCLFTDSMTSKVQYYLQAREAWKEYMSSHGGEEYCSDFACGFKEGYEQYLELGGETCPPPAPPLKYWKFRNQNAEGRAATKMWSLGYKEGAMAAKASGGRNFVVVPVNKCGPMVSGPGGAPVGPTLGLPTLPPGHPALNPQLPSGVPDIELPAPRPTPDTIIPPQPNTNGTGRLVPQAPRNPAGFIVSQPGPSAETISDGVPMQSIRSILTNKRTPSPSGPAIEPLDSKPGTPRSAPGASAQPPKSGPSKPQMLPPVPKMQFPALQSVPMKPVVPQDNKTSSIKPVSPQVSGKPMGSTTIRPRQQPPKTSDTAPVQSIRSLLSSEEHSENAAPRPTRSTSSSESHSPTPAPSPILPLKQQGPDLMPSSSTVPPPASALPVGLAPPAKGSIVRTRQPEKRVMAPVVSPSTASATMMPKDMADATPQRPTRFILPSAGTVKQQKETVTSASLAYGVGMASMQGGNVEAGLCWLQSAVKEDPNYVPAHKALMEYYQKIGDVAQAAAHRVKVEMQTP